MQLENVVIDAVNPRRLGSFWRAALGGTTLTDEPDAYELRLAVEGGPTLDVCLQRVPQAPTEPVRLHLDLLGGERQREVVDRLVGLGAGPVDIGQGEVPWVVLADPEGNAFCVMEDRAAYVDTGPIAAVPIDSADPAGDADFWAWLTGWQPVAGLDLTTLRHPSGRGPLVQFCPEPRTKTELKNRLHLDVRLDPGDDVDTLAAQIVARGGSDWDPGWGDLPWRSFRDPSGNEFCLLPARDEAGA